MRRFSFGVAIATLPAFALSLLLAGCGKDSPSSKGPGGGPSVEPSTPSKTQEAKLLEPGKGVLTGKVTLRGNPRIDDLTKVLHEDMKKKDTDYCKKGKESETTEQAYRVNDKGLLGNVFVWVIPPDRGTIFKVDENQLKELKGSKVKVRQPHCAFIPHCLFLFSEYHADPKKPRDTKPTGQELEIVNDAKIGHNTNWTGQRNKGDNVILEAGKEKPVPHLRPEPDAMTIKCNIHPWMKGYLRVIDTPYYAISHSDTLDGNDNVEKTDPKFGTYEIKGLPAGKVRVLVWHEECGFLNQNGGNGEEIEIKADGKSEKDFEATAK